MEDRDRAWRCVLAGLCLLALSVTGSGEGGSPRDASGRADGFAAAPSEQSRAGEVVTDRSLMLHDARRGKDLPLLIRYPKPASDGRAGDAKLPVVVFSHGMGGSREAFGPLSEHWASRGYAVIHCTHDDSVQLRRSKGEKLTLDSFMQRGVSQVDPVGRVDDIKLILDSLADIEQKIPALRDAKGRGRLDRERIGMAGHSAGALTTQMIAGAQTRLGRAAGAKGFADERIKAFMPISPQGVGRLGMGEGAWKDIKIPMLTVTGSEDTVAFTTETPESRKHPFEYSAALGNKYLLWIEGARHGSFQAAPGQGDALLPMTGRVMREVTTAFWDGWLRGDENAARWLNEPGHVLELSGGKAELSHK